jgi:hypothetical protein
MKPSLASTYPKLKLNGRHDPGKREPDTESMNDNVLGSREPLPDDETTNCSQVQVTFIRSTNPSTSPGFDALITYPSKV